MTPSHSFTPSVRPSPISDAGSTARELETVRLELAREEATLLEMQQARVDEARRALEQSSRMSMPPNSQLPSHTEISGSPQLSEAFYLQIQMERERSERAERQEAKTERLLIALLAAATAVACAVVLTKRR